MSSFFYYFLSFFDLYLNLLGIFNFYSCSFIVYYLVFVFFSTYFCFIGYSPPFTSSSFCCISFIFYVFVIVLNGSVLSKSESESDSYSTTTGFGIIGLSNFFINYARAGYFKNFRYFSISSEARISDLF
jgi:hypothetical protein